MHDLVTQTSLPVSHLALGLGSADKGRGLVTHFCLGDLVLQKMLSNLRWESRQNFYQIIRITTHHYTTPGVFSKP